MMATTRANENRRIRQEALIEQLRAKGLCQQVIESCSKLADLDQELDSTQVQRLKAANDGRLALVRKYLPDMKAVENTIVGDEERPVVIDAVLDIEAIKQKVNDITGD